VTNLNDSGAGSLRDAIATTSAGGTVDFQPGLTGTIALTSATLTIDQSLTIIGPGAKTLTVGGNQQFPLFSVPSGVTAAMTGLSIVEQGTSNFVRGGGILNRGTLTVTACVVSGFSSGGNPGPAPALADSVHLQASPFSILRVGRILTIIIAAQSGAVFHPPDFSGFSNYNRGGADDLPCGSDSQPA
jgi:hypothetical protein